MMPQISAGNESRAISHIQLPFLWADERPERSAKIGRTTRVSLHLLAHLETAPKTGACDHEEKNRSKTAAGDGGEATKHGHVSQEKLVNDHI